MIDKYGVKIFPTVADKGADGSVKIDRFRSTIKDLREYGETWRWAYVRQAESLAETAFVLTAGDDSKSLYAASRMLGKAAYAMRQAMRVNEELMRLEPKNNGGVN